MGSGADAGLDHARQSALQREIALGQDLRTTARPGATCPRAESKLAHANSSMTCYACHTSWTPNCFGCHLSMTRQPAHAHAAQRRPDDAQLDVVQLSGAARRRLHARHRRHGHGPSRRAGALLLRDPGEFAKSAIATGSTTRSRRSPRKASADRRSARLCRTRCARKETKGCTDCHVSQRNDNNAWMSHAAAAGHEFAELHGPLCLRRRPARRVSRPWPWPSTTSRRPSSAATCSAWPIPTIIASTSHASANSQTRTTTRRNVLDVQLRGEYLYAAMGKGGFRVFRRRQHRQQGLFRAHGDRARFPRSASAST